jgi:hypothetical protein
MDRYNGVVAIDNESAPSTDSVINSTSDGGGSFSDDTINLTLFRALVLVIAVIGAFANGFVGLIIALSQQMKKEKCNILFLNQMALEHAGELVQYKS